MIGEGVPTSPAKEGDDPHQIAHPVHHHQMKGHQMGEDHQAQSPPGLGCFPEGVSPEVGRPEHTG